MRSRFTIQPSRRSGAPRASGFLPATPTVIPRKLLSTIVSEPKAHRALDQPPPVEVGEPVEQVPGVMVATMQPVSEAPPSQICTPPRSIETRVQLLGLPRVAEALASTRETSPPAAVPVSQRDHRRRSRMSGKRCPARRSPYSGKRVLDLDAAIRSVSEPADILPHASAASTGPTFTPTSVVSPVIEHEAQAHRAVVSGAGEPAAVREAYAGSPTVPRSSCVPPRTRASSGFRGRSSFRRSSRQQLAPTPPPPRQGGHRRLAFGLPPLRRDTRSADLVAPSSGVISRFAASPGGSSRATTAPTT